jgi:predicted nucleic acid-binding protein
MIFVDSNVPMYLVGAAHPHKTDAERLIEEAILAGERLVTSAEVLQEVLHRFVAIGRRDGISPAFDVLLGIVDDVLDVTVDDVSRARDIVLKVQRLSARDAVHVAVMERAGIGRVMSFDRAFDHIPGLVRLAG